MGNRMIAVSALDLPSRQGSNYPAPHNAPCMNRSRRALGNAFGLSQFGVNLMDLPPGAWSSQRHWHESQGELIYVLEGEVVLVTDEGETILRPGMTAGFRAGTGNGHHLINRSDKVARVLEVGTRTVEEIAHYSDIDMMVRVDAQGSHYLAKDGSHLT